MLIKKLIENRFYTLFLETGSLITAHPNDETLSFTALMIKYYCFKNK